MIPLVAFLAVSVVALNDPLAPLQLLKVDAASKGTGLQICMRVRNDSREPIESATIRGSMYDVSGLVTVFLARVDTRERPLDLRPTVESRFCTTVANLQLRRGAVLQVAVQ